ncbi:MAG: ATP-binding protein [Mycoplasmataceae bacterium]|jgi:predicted AAA+ superfamily ATPase|nr:ATP-binding protein [Mycoplasmataceae bacterium]
MEIIRDKYIKKICIYKDTDFIKIITGIRRCGKTTIMKQYINSLDIDKQYILYIDMEKEINSQYRDVNKLQTYIDSYFKSKKNNKFYLFIDEVQEIVDFEKYILSLYNSKKFDIYITGSNSHLISSQLATRFTGREAQINIFPFSYQEFIESIGQENNSESLSEYLNVGGMPALLNFREHEVEFNDLSLAIVNNVINKDLIPFFNIKNPTIFKDLLKYCFSIVGNITSSSSISNFLLSQKITELNNHTTIDNYIKSMCDGYLLYKCERFNINGKSVLKSKYKLYAVDLGLANTYANLKSNINIGRKLENIVFFELKRRGYIVYIGNIIHKDSKEKTTKTLEIDFVAIRNKKVIYIQVCDDLTNQTTIDREVYPLNLVHDGLRIIINNSNINKFDSGIEYIDIKKWINKEESL